MNTTVAVTLVLYKLALLGIGLWAHTRTKNTADFFLGGRDAGPWVAALSYSASSSSAWTLLGMSGLAYKVGVYAIWLATGAVLGAVVAWTWVAPKLMKHTRERGQLSLTDFIANDSDSKRQRPLRLLASFIILVSFVFYIAAQFQGAGNTFSSTFNLSSSSSIMIGAAIVLAYSLVGGFWAVSLTDTLQGFIMLLASIVLPTYAYIAAGGWTGISVALDTPGTAHLLSLSAGNLGLTGAGFIIGGLSVGVSALGQPHLVSRFMALRDVQALRQARVIVVFWFTLVFFSMVLLGLSARALLPDLQNPETLFFSVTNQLFPPVVAGVMTAAVLSAIMSTADSMLLVGSASASHDILRGQNSPKYALALSRLSMVVLTVAAVAVSLLMPSSIFDRALFAWVAVGSAFGPVLIVRLAGIQVSPIATSVAVTTGFVLAVTFYLLPDTPGDIVERVAPFAAGVMILLACGRRKKAAHL